MIETTIETVVGQLTKDDVSALRKANVASFHWHGTFGEWRWEGNGHIRLTRRMPNAGPLDEQERTHAIEVDCRLKDYSDKDKAADWKRVYCFAYEGTCSQSTEWQTFRYFVKVGDVLTLEWNKDHYSEEYAKSKHGATLHFDSLTVRIKRGDNVFAFLVSFGLCEHNSARMIRATA